MEALRGFETVQVDGLAKTPLDWLVNRVSHLNIKCVSDELILKGFLVMIQVNTFWGELTNVSVDFIHRACSRANTSVR